MGGSVSTYASIHPGACVYSLRSQELYSFRKEGTNKSTETRVSGVLSSCLSSKAEGNLKRLERTKLSKPNIFEPLLLFSGDSLIWTGLVRSSPRVYGLLVARLVGGSN